MSELVREALRYYERRSWWDEVNAYGRDKAQQVGVREVDIDTLVHDSRSNHRASVNAKPAKK